MRVAFLRRTVVAMEPARVVDPHVSRVPEARCDISPAFQRGVTAALTAKSRRDGRNTRTDTPAAPLSRCVNRRRFRTLLASIAIGLISSPDAPAQTKSIQVNLQLRTGASISGPVLDYDDDGLVILREKTPYVFAWTELEGGNAYDTRGQLIALERGAYAKLTAEDHFRLGMFAFQQERRDLAALEFRRCKDIAPTYEATIDKAVAEFRRARKSAGLDENLDAEEGEEEAAPEGRGSDAPKQDARPSATAKSPTPTGEADTARRETVPLAKGAATAQKAEVEQAYRTFGDKVQQVLGKRVVLVESPHFLIWTDWERQHRDRLASWCEAMYAALCRQFDLKPDDAVFPARCPVFCFRSKARFQKFARYFDGYDGIDAVGYTRSIEQNGHVHVVVLRQGASAVEFDRFAATLVHEGAHAFVHRLYSSRLIPHWVNEGLAELTAERVLGDRCPAGETAALLARQFARHDWPISKLLNSVDAIGVQEYGIAESVVAFLDGLGRDRFAGFIADLKAGRTLPEALAHRYDGLTIEQLETRWRDSVRASDEAGRKGTGRPGG